MNYIKHELDTREVFEAVLSKEDSISLDFFEYDKTSPHLKHINEKWDLKCFEEVNLPTLINPLNISQRFFFDNSPYMRVLDMPIKFPGSNYRIPKELTHLSSIIYDIAKNEYSINTNINDYYCYLTIDSKDIEPGKTTRKEGLHVDGFQGSRIKDKLPIDHSYIIYNNNPTIFYNQKFKVEDSWDINCHNFFEGFESQKDVKKQVTYPNHSVLLMSAYCLHEAPLVTIKQKRVFLRLSFTVREFDRLGNAHNPLFDYDWEMVPRDIQKTLVCPTF